MGDSVSFSMVTEPYMKWSAERQVGMRRAAMWTVREGGRIVARAARAKAPVLKDTSLASYTQIRRGAKFRAGGGIGPIQGEGAFASNRPIPGLLKASIKPSKRLRQVGDGWALKVGPRGQRVHLYAGKEEAREGYMLAGQAAAEAMMKTAAEHAYGKVWRGI